MNKNFLFVHLGISTWSSTVNHGIAFLTPILKEYSHNVVCLYIDKEISCEEFRNRINILNPSIVGFSCTSHQLKYLIKYAKELEKYPKILTIAGGVGPTLDPEEVLHKSSIRGVCIGEGEIPLRNLLNNIEKGQSIFDAAGFYWRINGNIKKNLVPQFIDDLSTIAFPDYSIFEKRKILIFEHFQHLLMILSRGCPNTCSFCCNKALSSVYPSSNRYFRIPSVNYSIELLEKMIKYYPETKFIDFEDDNLIANRMWFKVFAEEYRKRINIPYRVCVRPECITLDILETLKQSKCAIVYMGLESGNEDLRNKLLNRKYSNSLFIEKCKMIKAVGLKLYTFNIVGFPFEGRKEMEDTFKLNKKVGPDSGNCYFFYPYKGTVLYRICQKNNLLKSDEEMMAITNYTDRPCIKMTARQEKECFYFKQKIEYLFGLKTKTASLSCSKRYFYILYHWLKFILWQRPLLYKIARQLYRLSHIGVFFR